MRQINMNVTPEFQRDLEEFMTRRKLKNKSEAIRLALREAVAADSGAAETDFRSWIGMGLRVPPRRKPRFQSEDELWS